MTGERKFESHDEFLLLVF